MREVPPHQTWHEESVPFLHLENFFAFDLVLLLGRRKFGEMHPKVKPHKKSRNPCMSESSKFKRLTHGGSAQRHWKFGEKRPRNMSMCGVNYIPKVRKNLQLWGQPQPLQRWMWNSAWRSRQYQGCKRDLSLRDRDETETFSFWSETRQRPRPRPRPSCNPTRLRQDRDVWCMPRDETETSQGRDRDIFRDLQPSALCQSNKSRRLN